MPHLVRMWNWLRGRWAGIRRPGEVRPGKVVVGLGNPGKEYQDSPHNLGFAVLDQIAMESQIKWTTGPGEAIIGLGLIGRTPVLLVKPQSYMNLSGAVVAGLLERFELDVSDLIVVCDDLALPLGRLRIRARGSSGGHKGLQSIIDLLKTQDFVRVRLGIAPERGIENAAEYVLRPIPPEFAGLTDAMVGAGLEAVDTILSHGVETAMNRFNG